jgi:hypothetical protein
MPTGLEELRAQLEDSLKDLITAAELVGTFPIPEFQRETEFVSLKGEGEYPWIGGRLVSSDGIEKAEPEYKAMTNEYVEQNNTSKWCRLSRESFAVGALARFNNNNHLLHPQAREIAENLGLQAVCHNPFMNNVAQLVECVHVVLWCPSLPRPGKASALWRFLGAFSTTTTAMIIRDISLKRTALFPPPRTTQISIIPYRIWCSKIPITG